MAGTAASADSSQKVKISLQPKQAELRSYVLDSRATYLGYGGSRGSAKSGGGRRIMLERCVENPGTTRCILRRTYDLVRENHIDKLLNEFPFLEQYYLVGNKELQMPNKAVLAFRYAENKKDVQAMIGKEYMDMLVDQAEAYDEWDLTTMKSIVRWPGLSETKCKFILTFNPGGVGHSYLQRVFYDKRYKAEDQKEPLTVDKAKAIEAETGQRVKWLEYPESYAFIQAYGWDNWEWGRSWLEERGYGADDYYSWTPDQRFKFYITKTQFGREQNALPPAMRVGWLLGRMDQFAGQYYDIFSAERHVRPCRPAEWSTRWLGIDWGFAHLSACYWASQVQPKLMALYREFCASGRSPKALAQEIVDRTPEAERSLVKHIFLSHDAFAQRTEADTIAEQMGSVFRAHGMPWPEQASKDPKGRATLLYDMMGPIHPDTGVSLDPEIVIDPSCSKLIQTIPMVCRDDRDKEKPLKFEGDDPFEGATHCLTYRMGVAKIPEEVLAMSEANKISDPVARWFYLRKHYPQKAAPGPIRQRVVMPWEKGRLNR